MDVGRMLELYNWLQKNNTRESSTDLLIKNRTAGDVLPSPAIHSYDRQNLFIFVNYSSHVFSSQSSCDGTLFETVDNLDLFDALGSKKHFQHHPFYNQVI